MGLARFTAKNAYTPSVIEAELADLIAEMHRIIG